MSYRKPSRQQPTRLPTSVRLGVSAVAACFISAPVLSLPVNPAVVNGSATFNQAGNVLTVTNSNGAIINWNKFSIQAGETTHFAQTSASSTVLNRVLNDPTAIYGTLSSNGRVWLVNPAGIMVGPGGKVDVAGFVASTLNISNADFLAGRNVFINDGSAGNVINQGEIRTPAGGSVYLIGSNVTNEGIIVTPKGETILAAGATVSLIDSATPGVKVDITGSEGNATNLGTITAEAGRIGIAGVIVRNSGQINASSVVSEGGRVFLKASQDAYVDGNGRIVTTGTKGGSVEVLGNRVAVMGNAEIDASGRNGGGKILVGGDYQGANSDIQNATITYFGPDASLKANATEVGDGGTVIVWSDDTTRAYGSISARGGAAGGNGGLVETSGKRYLDTPGIRVDVSAPNGKGGIWLLDPSEINIVAYGGTTTIPPAVGGEFSYGGNVGTLVDEDINDALVGGANVIVRTDGVGAGNGNITVTNAVIDDNGAGSGSLTLAAYGGSIGTTGNITITGSTIMLDGSFKALAGWNGATTYARADLIEGKGNLTISTSQILSNQEIDLHAGNNITLGQTGTGSTGTRIHSNGKMSVTANNLSLYGGSTVMFGISGAEGPGVMLRSDTEQEIEIENQILLRAGSADNTDFYGGVMHGGSVAIVAGGDQEISANIIKVHGGLSGHDNSAEIQADGNQAIIITGSGGLLEVKGGGDGNTSVYGGAGSFNNQARIQHGQYGGFGAFDQTITIYGGGAVAVYGGSGTGALGYYGSECASVTGNPELCRSSNNNAVIENKYGGQTLAFVAGGSLNVTGGSGGDQNWAGIENDGGDQTITGNPNITLTGGTGGRLFAFDANNVFDFTNDAGIYNEGSGNQIVYGGNITINGGGNATSYGGAGIGNEGTTGVTYISATGNLIMNGGASSAYGGFYLPGDATAAYINTESTNNSLTIDVAGTISLTGGSSYGGAVLIGTVDGGASTIVKVTAGGTFTAASGANSAVLIGNVAELPLGGAEVILLSGGNMSVTGTANAPVMIGSLNGGTNPTSVMLGSMRNVTLDKVNVGSWNGDAANIAVYGGYMDNGFGVPTPSGYGGSVSIGSGTIVYGGTISIVAAGNNVVYGSLISTKPLTGIYLNAGWKDDLNSSSMYGGDLILKPGSNLQSAGWIDMYAQAGTSSPYGGGSITQYGSLAGDGSIWMFADRNVTVNGSVSSNNSDIVLSAGYSVTRQFGGNIEVRSGSSLSGKYGVELVAEAASGSGANGKITQYGGSSITASNGEVRIIGGGNVALSGSIDGGEGGGFTAITVKAGFSDYGGAVTPYGGNITLAATSAINSDGDLYLYAESGSASGANGGITQNAGSIITANNGDLKIFGGGKVTLNGNASVYGGSGSIRAGYSAYGGAASANGGNIEVSGQLFADVDLDLFASAGSSSAANGNITQYAGSIIATGVGSSGGDITIVSAGTTTLNGTVSSGYETKIGAGFDPNTGLASTYGGGISFNAGSIVRARNAVDGTAITAVTYGGDITQAASSQLILDEGGDVKVLAWGDAKMNGTTTISNAGGYSINVAAGAENSAGLGSSFGLGNVRAGSSNIVSIGKFDAIDGDVYVQAAGAILRSSISNPNGPNILADSVTLTSVYGGSSNALAISSITEATGTIMATVMTGASYGGISIINLGDQPTSTVTLADGATSAGLNGNASISFYNAGNLALDGSATFSSSNGGDVAITSGGSLDYSSGLSVGAGDVLLGAGGGLTVSGSLAVTDNLSLSAGGAMNIDSSISGSNVTLVAPTININDASVDAVNDAILTGSTINIDTGGVSAANVLLRGPAFGSGNLNMVYGGSVNATGQLEFNLANITASDGSFLLASSASSNITGFISGGITLNNGSYFEAGDDINLSFSGGSSSIALSNGSYVVSDTQQSIAFTTNLNFLGRSGGGVLIDGKESTTTSGSTGFFVFDTSTPATTGPGGGLVITYANSIVIDPCASSPDLCKPPTPVDPIVKVVDADPCATAPDSAQCKAQKPNDDKDKEKEQFGDEQENGKKDEKSSQKKVAQCGI